MKLSFDLYPYQKRVVEAIIAAGRGEIRFVSWPRRCGRAVLGQMFAPANNLLGVKMTTIGAVESTSPPLAGPRYVGYTKRPHAIRGRRAKPRSKGG